MTTDSILEREQILPKPRSEVFAFFADAGNLERITPPFLGFQILTPLPISMKSGAIIEYRIRLFGVPMRWRTRIDSWTPETSFVDVQERGPYALWHHTHSFEELEGGRTRMIDRVVYRAPLGVLGSFARWLFIARTLDRIFDYRYEVIEQIFGRAR